MLHENPVSELSDGQTGYGLDVRGSRVRFPAGAGNFSLHHRVQNGTGTHPASYPMGTRGSFPGGKAAGGVKLTTHLHIVSRSRLRGAIPPLPQYVFIAWCLVKHRDNFTFTYLMTQRDIILCPCVRGPGFSTSYNKCLELKI
jgi:hypothetical protein